MGTLLLLDLVWLIWARKNFSRREQHFDVGSTITDGVTTRSRFSCLVWVLRGTSPSSSSFNVAYTWHKRSANPMAFVIAAAGRRIQNFYRHYGKYYNAGLVKVGSISVLKMTPALIYA